MIVFISIHYKRKMWTRYEWDVIIERKPDNRYIPIRLDDTKILGLSSNIIFEKYDENKFDDIITLCIQKLILYEQSIGYKRPSDFEKTLSSITNESKGSLAKAYQLVVDNRKRTPLDDIKIPSEFPIRYTWDRKDAWFNFSVVRRLVSYILVPKGLSDTELSFNLKHAALSKFNEFKPDVIRVYSSCNEIPEDIYEYNAGSAVFAPFGEWDKAEEGVAYNIPSSEFKFTIDIRPIYKQYSL